MSPTAPPRPLILASTSPYRAALLGRLGLSFEVQDPAVTEVEVADEAPRLRALRLSRAKADAVARRFPQAVVIGGDQVAAAHGSLLHKPGNAQRCREQLTALSGATAEFHTACTVRSIEAGLELSHVDLTTVIFRALSSDEIERYVERERPFDCAGGFKAEALGISLFERMESLDPTAIVGTPLIWLAGALRAAGYAAP